MISISNLGKFFGEQTLFENVSIQFNPGERYGIVGANGSGKSTLLKILAGEEGPSEGNVSVPKTARLGVLKQDHFAYEEEAILDVVMMGHEELWTAMEEKEKVLANADKEFDADRYSELEDVIMANDGYAMEARAGEILEGLGIQTEVHRNPLSTLSGGFKLRVLLAQVLAAEPDVLILDEPTNHLDILSIRWLEKFLEGYRGCSLVVSHDHRFLDNVSTWIADVDYETILLYKGNYSAFERQKQEERDRREHEINKQEKKKAEQQAFIDRFKAKASKARQAQSKVKLIERMEVIELPKSSRRWPRFNFQQVRPTGKLVVEAEGINKSYGEGDAKNQVLHDVKLEIRRGDRVAIIGPNGIGKSTLLKVLVNAKDIPWGTPPDEGDVDWGHETYPGYFAQDHKEQLGTDGPGAKRTIEEWLWDFCPGEPVGFVRGQLGAVLFTKEEVKKKLSSLSGGEASRLILARQVVEKPNVLILDEPTNHLDLEAIDSLVKALDKYEGTLIFVSHDRWFVNRLATRILEISENGINDFEGTYEEYLEKLGDDHLDSDVVLRKARADKKKAKEAKAAAANGQGPGASKNELKKLERQRDEITKKIEKAENRVGEINEVFCDPSYFEKASPKEVRKLETEQKKLKGEIEAWMAEWEGVEERIGELV
ncbi:MAG: ABC-F family ATP-binding cassette domain-containing protein [Acidobacteriota bacterium]